MQATNNYQWFIFRSLQFNSVLTMSVTLATWSLTPSFIVWVESWSQSNCSHQKYKFITYYTFAKKVKQKTWIIYKKKCNNNQPIVGINKRVAWNDQNFYHPLLIYITQLPCPYTHFYLRLKHYRLTIELKIKRRRQFQPTWNNLFINIEESTI